MSRKHPETLPPGEVVKPPAPTPGEDVNLGVIVRAGVVLGTAVIVVAALLILFMRALEQRAARADRAPGLEGPWETFPDQMEVLRKPEGGVLLQRQPFGDLEVLRDEEEKWLSGPTQWIDKDAGIVHIPIEDAMKLLVRRGLPVRGIVSSASSAPTAAAAPSPRPKKAHPRPRPEAGQ